MAAGRGGSAGRAGGSRGSAKSTNLFAIWISVGVVVALVAIAGLVVWMNNIATDPGERPAGANINSDTGAISFGDGDDTLDTYIDFMCPACNGFETAYGEGISDLVDDGTITLNVHPIGILDHLSQGTQFSTRAASAMYCVAADDPDAAMPFVKSMFLNQPDEGSTGLADEEIIAIAEDAGAKDSADCITDGTYMDFVTAFTKKTPVVPGAQGISTPTIVVNGEPIKNSTLPAPADLADLFK